MPQRESPRPRRVADRIVEELAECLASKTEDPRLRTLAVTGARVTRDLSAARVWVSGTMTAEEEPSVLKALVHATPFLRSYLAPRLGLRIVPTLAFQIDKSIETGTRIEQLLRDLDRREGE